MDYGLAGKHVLVTGGATGIGRAIAAAFIAEGAMATISGLSTTEVAAACEQLGAASAGLAGDLTKAGEADRLADFAEARAPVDILINNIGVFEVRDFFETTDERWFEYFDINVMTAVRMTRRLMRPMLERGHGSIVFISSESAVKPQGWMVHYGAMKTCLLGLSRALAELTKGTRVTVKYGFAGRVLLGPRGKAGRVTMPLTVLPSRIGIEAQLCNSSRTLLSSAICIDSVFKCSGSTVGDHVTMPWNAAVRCAQ